MARTFYSKCLSDLRDAELSMEIVEDCGDGRYKSCYLGSFMSLDPCGRYHHILSPNGSSNRCEAYWKALDKAAYRLGGWIGSGEGDPTDIYFCLLIAKAESED